MAALTIDSTQVAPDTGGDTYNGIVGTDAITAGMSVYLNADDSKLYPADANASVAAASAIGVALNDGTEGQPCKVQRGGDVYLGAMANPTPGVVYVVGAAPGDIAPATDLTTGWYTTILGTGMNAGVANAHQYRLRLHVLASRHLHA